ncbi:hypothetical protein GGR56DRAFT_676165 [Xylariaceae sp. FL0804]|nr:hypothetical protein GGR56DRAFT_676165 [Xylariaceae sp. FL0804]
MSDEPSGPGPDKASAAAQTQALPARPRQLFAGRLKPPVPPPAPSSYTVSRASPAAGAGLSVRDEGSSSSHRRPAAAEEPVAVATRAVAQPFVDPAVLERHGFAR